MLSVVGVLALWTLPLSAASYDAARADEIVGYLQEMFGPGVAQSKTYVGSEVCAACHPDNSL